MKFTYIGILKVVGIVADSLDPLLGLLENLDQVFLQPCLDCLAQVHMKGAIVLLFRLPFTLKLHLLLSDILRCN